MKTSDIVLTLIIIIIFIGIYAFNTFSVGIDNIKKNWPLYRCNPTVMPFASWFGHDPIENFTYCIQNMQTSYMGNLLKPTNYAMSLMHNLIQGIMDDINWIRKKIENLVSNLMNIISSIMGTFVNIIIQFQKLIIKLKDTVSKVLGIVTTIVYLIDSGIKTGESTMAGPIGGTLRYLCFHPDTLLKTKTRNYIKMKDIEIGDVLDKNRKVIATMKLKGSAHEPFYKLYSTELNDYIYVTGGHLIQDPISNEFIHVRDMKNAELCCSMDNSLMSCLITDDHLIEIGEYLFWDWED